MESVLEFISYNYIWLLIILVIILLAILGYIAEKNGFTEKINKKGKNNLEKQEFTKVDEVENINQDSKENNELEKDTNVFENDINQIEENNTEEENKVVEEKDIEENNEVSLNYDESLNIEHDFNKLLNDVEETSSDANIEIPDEMPIELDEEEDIWKF